MKQKFTSILFKTSLLMSVVITLFFLTSCMKNAENSSEITAASDDDVSTEEVTPTEMSGELYLRTVYSGGRLQISWIYLGADGTIIKNPIFGVNPIQKSKELADNAQGTGTYTKTAKGFDIKWADGSTQSLNAEYKGEKLSGFDGGVCTKAIPFTITSFPNETYLGSGSFAGSNSQSITLKLNADNTFSWTSKMYMQATSSYQETVKTGTYELKDNTLRFMGPDDFIYNNRYFTVQPYDMGTSVDLILGSSHFKKKM